MPRHDHNVLDRFKNPSDLMAHTMQRLVEEPDIGQVYPRQAFHDPRASAVLFLLGNDGGDTGFTPCLILNKRSLKVRQAGDLCCPGGGITPGADRILARILTLPGFPLSRWPHWRTWRKRRPEQALTLAVLLATCLRESLEEMRLNPMGVTFLGPLPTQHLVMFKKAIFPMAGWVRRQKRYFPNWEVEKIIRIPLKNLVNPENYVNYRLQYHSVDTGRVSKDFPCFVHRGANRVELLWGATYKIAAAFLSRVFAFRPPATGSLPVIHGALDKNYGRNGKGGAS